MTPLVRRGASAVLLGFVACAAPALAQESLRQTVRRLADDARGTVYVACALPGSALNCDLRPHGHPPMQSVFKLPLVLAVLQGVEQGRWSLDQSIRFLPADRILPHAYSPLQEKYSQAGVDVPLRELLRLTASLSDNVAADILMRVLGGPAVVQRYMGSLGIAGFQLRDNEAVLHRRMRAQYRNWFEPAAAVQLLQLISDRSPLNVEHTKMLMGWMVPEVRGPRLEADLPWNVRAAHRSGTSDVDAGVAHATNDIGLILLPDGRRIAVAVFLTDSRAEFEIREKVIARIGRAVYDAVSNDFLP